MHTALLALVLALSAGATELHEVPQPARGRWSVDLTGTLPAETLAQVDALGAQVDAEGVGQLAVVVVVRTASGDPRGFALQLFNRWGIGSAARNDGALLFVSLEERAAEIILGDGVDDVHAQAQSDMLMANVVVPAFKRGAPAAAVLEGAEGLVALLRNVTQRAQDERLSEVLDALLAPYQRVPSDGVMDPEGLLDSGLRASLDASLREHFVDRGFPAPIVVVFDAAKVGARAEQVNFLLWQRFDLNQSPGVWLVAFAAGTADASVLAAAGAEDDPTGVQALWQRAAPLARAPGPEGAGAFRAAVAALGELEVERRADLQRGERIDAVLGVLGRVNPLAVLFGGGLAFLGGRELLRRRPRTCERCRLRRRKLEESADDVHLDAGQQSEERLSSIDYDVWWCEPCQDARVLPWRRLLSRRRPCTGCGYRTALQHSTTLVEATSTHGGSVRVTRRCGHCAHEHSFTRATPRRTRSSSSSGSRSSGSSGSFGGGRSSGGGSSGRW